MPFEVVDLDHVAFRVSDIDEALTFYRDLLGLSVRDFDRYEAGELPFVTLVAGGRHLHLFPVDEPINVGNDHLCLLFRSHEVDTHNALTEFLEELREAGVAIDSDEPQQRLGAYGRDWAAYVKDPDDRTVELKFH